MLLALRPEALELPTITEQATQKPTPVCIHSFLDMVAMSSRIGEYTLMGIYRYSILDYS